MLGQHGHFALYAAEKIPYAIERYRDEAARLYGVLDRQLGKTGAYVAGDDYSIADIACFPWTMTHKAQGFTLDDYPNVKRWYAVVRARPQVQAGLAIGKFVKEPFDEEARKNMFGAEGEGDGGEEVTLTSPSLRGALATKQSILFLLRRKHGLLRCARNDVRNDTERENTTKGNAT